MTIFAARTPDGSRSSAGLGLRRTSIVGRCLRSAEEPLDTVDGPHLKLVQANHKLYVDYHHRILKAIDKHIPVEDVMSIDEVACRLDKLQQQPAVARKLARDIKREIESQVGACLTSSIGISANKLLAKLASNMQKPDGLVILPIEELPGAILHLKLRDIPGIGPNMAERLQKAGITDIATLWEKNASRLRLI
jgi:DNA polymerase IV